MNNQYPNNITVLGETGGFLMFGPNNTTMCPILRYALAVGTKVFASGPGCDDMWFVVTKSEGEEMEMVAISPEAYNKEEIADFYYPDRYWSPKRTFRADEVRPLSQKFGIGFYFDESGELVAPALIERSIQYANDLEAYEEQKKAEAEAKNRELAEHFKTKYSYLALNQNDDIKVTISNIKSDLSHEFPGIKFAVTKKSDTVYVKWSDGPTEKEVRSVTDKYYCYSHDWSGDYYDYTPTVFTRLFGGIKYASHTRTILPATIESVRKEFADLTEENKTKFDNSEVRYALYSHGATSVREIIDVIAYSRSYSAPVDVKKPVGAIETRDYIILLGNSKPIKEELKALGATFNPHLSCGAGWILPVSKKEEALALSKEIAAVNLIALFGDTKAIKNELKALGAIFSPYLADGAGWAVTTDKKEAIQKLIEP